MSEGTVINSFMNTIIQHLDAGYALVEDDVTWLFRSLVVIQLTLAGLYWAMGAGGQMAASLMRRFLFISFVLFLIQEFPTLVDTVSESFIQLGIKAGGSTISRQRILDPGQVATIGWESAELLWKEARDLTGPIDTLSNIFEIVVLFVSGVVVLLAHLAIALQVFIAFISLKLGSLVCYVLLPFAVFQGTAFIIERPLGWLIGLCVRLMLIALVVSAAHSLFAQLTVGDPQDVQLREAIALAFGAGILWVMTFLASRLANDLVSGVPSLGLGDVATVAAGTAGGAYMAGKVTGLDQLPGRTVRAVRAAVRAL